MGDHMNRNQILYYAVQYDGEYRKIKQAIDEQKPWHNINYAQKFVTIVDEEYPNLLKQLQDPPFILFYKGNLDLLKRLGVCVIGSRMPTSYGLQMTRNVVSIVKENYVIISGLAKGIDGCAHKEAMNKDTIGVIGCGLDQYYPSVNRLLQKDMEQYQLVISEYPNGVKPLAYHFPWRNRIIAALSHAVVVIEASMKSGTMLTVNEALKLDIPIYCIPHAFDNLHGIGNNFLIAQGAYVLVDYQDIRMI